jgi:hypothetical protein
MRILVSLATALILSAVALAESQPKPEETEVWEPVPKLVKPGTTNAGAPADALVLFDGKSLDGWESVNGGPAKWIVANGALTVAPGTGDIRTREHFGDVQLHIEWRAPKLPPGKTGQDRGNSGVFFQELYEVQILDTLGNRTYSNGQAGAIYKQHIPLVNAARPAGEWQAYDIVFIAPRFEKNGKLRSPARVTAFHNGVLIQHDVTLEGVTTYIGKPAYAAHGDGALRLQDHSHMVSFRNVWVRKLTWGGVNNSQASARP